MKEQLEQLKAQALTALQEATTPAALEELRVRYLGKKGEVTAVLKQMGGLSAEERPIMGQLANSVRAEIESKLEERKTEIDAAVLEQKLAAEALDVTIPGETVVMGREQSTVQRRGCRGGRIHRSSGPDQNGTVQVEKTESDAVTGRKGSADREKRNRKIQKKRERSGYADRDQQKRGICQPGETENRRA